MLDKSSQLKAMSVKLDIVTKNRIENLANQSDRTPHWIMKEAIKRYLDEEEARVKLNQETVEAWERYEATGLYATGQSVNAWLASWGKSEPLDIPSCQN